MDIRITNTRSIFNIYDFARTATPIRKSRAEESYDSVKLSEQAKDYNVALKAVRSLPDIRENRINEVLKKIETGQEATPYDIAEKLVDGYFNILDI